MKFYYIAATEIGENAGLYMFGFITGGIIIAYVMGYPLAGSKTFITILGRHGKPDSSQKSDGAGEMDSCCSVLEEDSTKGFESNLKTNFSKFALGFKHLLKIREQLGIRTIVRNSLFQDLAYRRSMSKPMTRVEGMGFEPMTTCV